jgi:hypothetical protein
VERCASIFPLIICKIWQFYCLFLPIPLTFVPSFVQRCQMLSGSQSRLHLNSFFSSRNPHILLLISAVAPHYYYYYYYYYY